MVYDFDDDGRKSRSQKKRESTALQKYGEDLAAMTPAVWKKLPLTDDLLSALAESRTIKSREALRRQMQYIGRLMRELDEDGQEALSGAIDALRDAAREDAAMAHKLEALRDALLAPDLAEREAAVADAALRHPGLDSARLRHLAEAAVADREKNRPPKHARELFRYLRAAFQAAPVGG